MNRTWLGVVRYNFFREKIMDYLISFKIMKTSSPIISNGTFVEWEVRLKLEDGM